MHRIKHGMVISNLCNLRSKSGLISYLPWLVKYAPGIIKSISGGKQLRSGLKSLNLSFIKPRKRKIKALARSIDMSSLFYVKYIIVLLLLTMRMIGLTYYYYAGEQRR